MGIRVPRITLKADFGDDASFGELRALSLGYGLHQAWIFAAMFGASSIFGVPDLMEASGGGAISLAFLVSIIVYAATLLFCAATDQKFLSFYVSRKTTVGAAASMALGTLMLVPVISGTAGMAVHVVAGVMTGIGSGLLILQWGTAFARHEQPTIVINTAVAIAAGVVVYAVVLHLVPRPASGVIAALLPLLEMALLLQETPQPFTEREERPIFQPLPVNRGKFFMKLGLPIAVLGIALGALRQTSVQTILPAATGTEQALAVLAACGALVLVLVTLLALQSASGWNRLFRPLVPFVAVVVFLFPVGGSDGSVISSLALLVGYMSFEAMLWICFGELSQQYRLSPVLVFGAGRGIQAITSLFGSMMPVFAVAWADILPMGNSTVIVILLLAMVFAYALLPSESEIRKLVLDCPVAKLIANDGFDHAVAAQQAASARSAAEEAAGFEASDRPSSSAVGAQDETPAAREDADAASMHAASSAPSQPDDTTAPNQAARQAAQLEPTASMDTPSAGAGEAAPASSAAAPAAPAASTPAQAAPASTTPAPADDAAARGQSAHVAPAPAATPSAPTAPASATSHAAYVPATAASPAAMGSSSGGSIWPTEKRGRFKRKCEATANRYLLSARETEVLFFLAKGHNATSIQEQLYISEGTTKTHIRHIYRKLDVHSQQELIQIVENAEVD